MAKNRNVRQHGLTPQALRAAIECLGRGVQEVERELSRRAGESGEAAEAWRRSANAARRVKLDAVARLREALAACRPSYAVPDPAGDGPLAALAAAYGVLMGRVRGTEVSPEEQAVLDRPRREFARHGVSSHVPES